VNLGQIKQMATFFGIKGTELKKVQVMATRGEETRLKPAAIPADPLNVNNS
jgi:hypothetical protein